jgi:hypothetical protein
MKIFYGKYNQGLLYKNYETKELGKESTCSKIAQVQSEGRRKITRFIEFYNLEKARSFSAAERHQAMAAFRLTSTIETIEKPYNF